MLELDEKYREYLDDTSVYYEMYAKGISTDTIVDINNYKSTQYFSENNKVSFGFFGMATCEFEIEEKSLTENEHVQIMAVTPGYSYYNNEQVGELPIYSGVKMDGKVLEDYKKIMKYLEERDSSAIPISATIFNVGYMGSAENILYVYCIYEDSDIYLGENPNEDTFSIILDSEQLITYHYVTSDGSIVYGRITGSQFVPTNILTYNNPNGRYACILKNFSYLDNEYIVDISEKTGEFPVFTGFVDKIEENSGTYKVTCNDVSQIFDTHLTGNDVPKLVNFKKYKDVLNYFMNDYVKTWRMKKNTNNADEYGNEDYEEITGGYDRFYLPVKMYGATQREIIANICGQIGANAYVNNVGELVIKSYQYNFAIPTNASILYEDGLKINYSVSNVANKWNFILSLSDTENPETYTFERKSDLSGNEVNIYFKNITKQAFNLSSYEVFNRFIENTMCYAEDGTAEFVGNFVYEVGDMIILYDSNYNSHILVISRLEHQCDGGLITKISSFIKNTSTSSTSKDANTSYSGSSSSVQNMESIINLQKQITSVNEDLADFKEDAVQSVKLNGTELKSGTTATIPIASSTQDGALAKELYNEINSEITEEQIDEWFGTELDLGVNVFGNYSNKIQTETLLTTAIVGTEVTDA